jgi:hypothetical protein
MGCTVGTVVRAYTRPQQRTPRRLGLSTCRVSPATLRKRAPRGDLRRHPRDDRYHIAAAMTQRTPFVVLTPIELDEPIYASGPAGALHWPARVNSACERQLRQGRGDDAHPAGRRTRVPFRLHQYGDLPDTAAPSQRRRGRSRCFAAYSVRSVSRCRPRGDPIQQGRHRQSARAAGGRLRSALELREAQQRRYATSTTNVSLDLVQLFKALGGGWETALPDLPSATAAVPVPLNPPNVAIQSAPGSL